MGISRKDLAEIQRRHGASTVVGKASAGRLDASLGSKTSLKSTHISARTRKGIEESKRRALEFKRLCYFRAIPEPCTEVKFHPHRRFRFDFAWPEVKVALEVDGGQWIRGRHNRGEADHEKLNQAARLGWRVLRTTPKKLFDYETFELVSECVRPIWITSIGTKETESK